MTTYQQTVLNANQEVENGLVTFLRAQRRTNLQAASVADTEKAVEIVLAQYKAGTADFTRVTQVEQTLVLQQDVLAQARGEIATGLIQVYRALGGGWQIRLTGCTPTALPVQTGTGYAHRNRADSEPRVNIGSSRTVPIEGKAVIIEDMGGNCCRRPVYDFCNGRLFPKRWNGRPPAGMGVIANWLRKAST